MVHPLNGNGNGTGNGNENENGNGNGNVNETRRVWTGTRRVWTLTRRSTTVNCKLTRSQFMYSQTPSSSQMNPTQNVCHKVKTRVTQDSNPAHKSTKTKKTVPACSTTEQCKGKANKEYSTGRAIKSSPGHRKHPLHMYFIQIPDQQQKIQGWLVLQFDHTAKVDIKFGS